MAPLDFVILEGWCVGFTPLPETDIQDAHLSEINKMLADGLAELTRRADELLRSSDELGLVDVDGAVNPLIRG